MDAALEQAAGRGLREVGGLWLFEQTASPNKCGQGSAAAVTEVVGGIEKKKGEEEGGEGVVYSFCTSPPPPSLSALLCLTR